MTKGKAKKTAATDNGEGKSFEAIVERLETIADQLERGEPELEESLKLFEEGVRLAQHGTSRLNEAEARLEVLLQNGSVEPLDSQPIEEPAKVSKRPSPEPDDVPF